MECEHGNMSSVHKAMWDTHEIVFIFFFYLSRNVLIFNNFYFTPRISCYVKAM